MIWNNKTEQLQNLVCKWEAGDQDAGNEFVEQTVPLIKHYIENMRYQRFQSRVDTQDLTQIVLEKLMRVANRKRLSAKVTQTFYGWLKKFVTFTVLKEIRNQCAKKRDWRRQTSLESTLTEPFRNLRKESELKLVINEVLESLCPNDRKLVKCLAHENSQAEIAEILDIHPRTVRRRIAGLRQTFTHYVLEPSNN